MYGRKLLAAVLVFCLVFAFAGCGETAEAPKDSLQEYLDEQGISKEDLDAAIAAAQKEEETQQPEAPAAPVEAPETTEEPAAPSEEPATMAPTATPEPTAKPTPTPTPEVIEIKYPVITKNPTSETLYEGGNAIFIAYADDYQYLTWRLVSKDGKITYTMNEAPYYFSGLSVTGASTSKLTLCNCPLSINGWKVECSFTGNGRTETTTRASVNVSEAPKPQLYASPSAGYVQFCDQTIYLIAGKGDSICYTLYRGNSYSKEKYAEGIVKSGEAVYLGCDNGICWTYNLYAYVANDTGNAISCEYTVDGIMYDEEHTIYATECDQYGYAFVQNFTEGLYRFKPENSNGVTWDVYVLNDMFTDANRYISQSHNAVLSGPGTVYVPYGAYVYVYCSANQWNDGPAAPDGCRITFKLD